MPIVPCKTCGQNFKIKSAHIRPGGNCCSKACRSTGVTKKCEVCSVSFYATHARLDQSFCSRRCKGVASRRTRVCLVCGVTYHFRKIVQWGDLQYPGGGVKYCSKKCFGVGHATGEIRPCKVCGVDVWVTQNRLVKQDAFFCTKDHANDWARRNKTTHTCKICQKVFQWSPSRTKSGAYNITYCSLVCRDADPAKEAQLLGMRIKQQTMRESSLETKGYALLDEMGIQYIRQHVINGRFTVDVFIPEALMVIQWDGDYWHGHPVRFPKVSTDARVRRRMALDISQDAYLAKCGYRVVRVWESEFKASVEAVKGRIKNSLASPFGTPLV